MFVAPLGARGGDDCVPLCSSCHGNAVLCLLERDVLLLVLPGRRMDVCALSSLSFWVIPTVYSRSKD